MKLLFLTIQNIFGTLNNGGSQCSRRNYELLEAQVGKKNIYAAIICDEKEIQNRNLKNACFFHKRKGGLEILISLLYGSKTYAPKEEKKIIDYVEKINPDIIFLDNSVLGKLLGKIKGKRKIITFFSNVEVDFARHKVENSGLIYLPTYWVTKYNEKKTVEQSDYFICLNERDRKRLNQVYGISAGMVWPITFKDKFDFNKIEKSEIKKELLFIGSFFPPNYYGIKWFVEEIMVELTEYKLTIVGRGFENKKEELERENVIVLGTVESLDEYYYSFPALVMPILYGDGMKVKTAEAMMYGKTIFASKEALEGYDVSGLKKGIYECGTKEEYINAIRKCFKDKVVERYNAEVRQLFLEKYETNNLISDVKNLLMEATSK